MLITTQVIVFHSFMFSDSKMMVDVFSRGEGRFSCVLRVSKSGRGRALRQLFQPLSRLELTVERKSPSRLAEVREAHIAYAYATLPFDPYKLTISMFLAEFLSAVTRSEAANPQLFDYISDSMEWLDGVAEGFSNFHLVFMMRLTLFIGFYPNLDDFVEGCRFDLVNGCFAVQPPFADARQDSARFLSVGESAVMYQLMRMTYGNMRLFRLSRQQRNRCLDVIVAFYRLHVPDFRELKSLDVLRELFS